jgi:hypothetical protein
LTCGCATIPETDFDIPYISEEADIIATGVKEDDRFFTLHEIETNEATLERET